MRKIFATAIAALVLISTPATAAPAGATSAKAYARSYMKAEYGWGVKQHGCLVKVWERESHWNHRATGAGGKYLGIPQLNAGAVRNAGYSKAEFMSSYRVQVRVGLKYIKKRYGNPCSAWNHVKRTGWY